MSSQRPYFSLGLSSNVTASAKPSLTSLGEHEKKAWTFSCSPSGTEHSAVHLVIDLTCLPNQLETNWRAQIQLLSVWTPMSHSVSSPEEVISQCLLREKRLGLQEREGEGEDTELSILRRNPGENWKEFLMIKAWVSTLPV